MLGEKQKIYQWFHSPLLALELPVYLNDTHLKFAYSISDVCNVLQNAQSADNLWRLFAGKK